jgi:tetratricopeptide (TPR) repeat protein
MVKNNQEYQDIGGTGSILKPLKNNDPSRCPAPELLAGFHDKGLHGKMKRQIEDHIAFCPLCLKALEAMQAAEETGLEKADSPENWPSIEKALDKKFHERMRSTTAVLRRGEGFADKKTVRRFEGTVWPTILEILLRPKRLVYSGAFTSVVIAGLYSYAYLNRDNTFSISRIQPEKLVQMRAETSESGFAEGLRQYSRGKYGNAITRLENYIKENPDHYAAHYYLGISRLADAEVSILGLPYRFDMSEVEKGICDLSKARLLGGSNPYYTADCCWYLGKAHLMKNEPEKAEEWFNAILRLDSPYPERKEEALKMISALSRLGAE